MHSFGFDILVSTWYRPLNLGVVLTTRFWLYKCPEHPHFREWNWKLAHIKKLAVYPWILYEIGLVTWIYRTCCFMVFLAIWKMKYFVYICSRNFSNLRYFMLIFSTIYYQSLPGDACDRMWTCRDNFHMLDHLRSFSKALQTKK